MSVTRFEKMRLDEINKQLVVAPWPKPGFNVPVMPAGLMSVGAAGNSPVQINHMKAAMFASQMGMIAEITITWALDQAKAFHNKTLAEFGALVRFAQQKASQQALADTLVKQIFQSCGESVLDFAEKRRDAAATIMKFDPLAVQTFILEAIWASEWFAGECRNTRMMTHPAIPHVLATERRVDAEVRGVVKAILEATAGACSDKEAQKAASDLRSIYQVMEHLAAHFAASYTSLSEIVWATEPFTADRQALFAEFEQQAAYAWARPTARLPRLVQFLVDLEHGDRLLWMTGADRNTEETDEPFLAISA